MSARPDATPSLPSDHAMAGEPAPGPHQGQVPWDASCTREQDQPGSATLADIERMARVGVAPGPSSGVRARLEQGGLIAPLPAEDRRRPSRITAVGAAALREQLASLHAFATTGLARLAAI